MPGETDHLLIDGYNVIHAWPELRGLLGRSVDAARERLIETCRVIREVDGLRVTLVFDSSRDTAQVETPGEDQGYAVLYAPKGVSADGLIEQIVRRAKKPTRCVVISRDNLVLEAVRASGGFGYFPEELLDWVRRCEARLAADLDKRKKATKKQWKEDSPWDALG